MNTLQWMAINKLLSFIINVANKRVQKARATREILKQKIAFMESEEARASAVSSKLKELEE